MLIKIIRISFLLVTLLGVGYFIHLNLLSTENLVAKKELLKFSYLYNFGFSSLLLFNYIIFRKKLLSLIGFVFLAFGVVKIGLFYFLVKQSDFEKNKSTFLLFFIPFVICLAIEIFYLAKDLNHANFNNDN